MEGMIIFSIIVSLAIVVLPRLRQLDDEITKEYNKKNKWKENITQHFNGHHQNIGYQDYKKNSYDDYEY